MQHWLCWCTCLNYLFSSILELIEPIAGSLQKDRLALSTRLKSVVNISIKWFDRAVHRPVHADDHVALTSKMFYHMLHYILSYIIYQML